MTDVENVGTGAIGPTDPDISAELWRAVRGADASLAERIAGMQEEDFTSAGGVRIHMRSWLPDGPARAVLVICHGVNSHGGQHAWTATQFAERGLAVYALDLRGRGKSDGERFYVEDIADYVAAKA